MLNRARHVALSLALALFASQCGAGAPTLDAPENVAPEANSGGESSIVAMPVTSVDVRVSIEGDTAAPHEQRPRIQFQGNVIPGSLFGNALRQPVFEGDMANGESLGIDLRKIEPSVAEMALSLSSTADSAGLVSVPTDVRIARIGFIARGLDRRYQAALVDEATKTKLMLVFVDRGCRVSGATTLDGVKYTFQVVTPGRGFYWIGAKQTSPKTAEYEVVTGSGRHILFRVWPQISQTPRGTTT